MRFRSLSWCLVCVFAIALIAGAPPTAFCDVTEVDTGGIQPLGNQEGLRQGVDARHLDDNGTMFVAFYNSEKSVTMGTLNGDRFGPINPSWSACDNPSQVGVSVTEFNPEEALKIITVLNSCGGNYYVWLAHMNAANSVTESREVVLENATGMNSASVDSKTVDGVYYQSFCGSDGTETYCWQTNDSSAQSLPRTRITAPGGTPLFSDWVHHRYDDQGNLHMVGTNNDGELHYAKIPVGSTEADPDSYVNLGAASQTQSWRWPQVGVSQNYWVWASANNEMQLAVFDFRKEPGSSHWFFSAATTSTGGMGMYNSMAVDNDYAYQTFTDGANNVRTVTVSQSGEMNTQAFGPYDAPVYSTATAVGTNTGGPIIKDHIWFGMNKGRATFYRYRY